VIGGLSPAVAVDWLPALIPFDWNDYAGTIELAYGVFVGDFIASAPSFQGRRVRTKRHPEFQGKNCTFWHLVTEGPVEQDRVAKRERVEQIGCARAVVDNVTDPSRVLFWSEQRSGETRWQLALTDFSYLVVLADRGTYVLLWTAYPVEHEHQRAKLRKRLEASLR